MKNGKIAKPEKCIGLLHAIVVATIAILIVLLQMSHAHAASDSSGSATDYYIEVSGNKVYVMDVGSGRYLFLPSEADITDIRLFSEKEGQTVRFSENGLTYLDLSFRGILPKDSYVTNVHTVNNFGAVEESFSLTIMQGSGIGSLYFNSSEPDKYGRLWIDRSKDNRSSGTAIVTDKDGRLLNPGEKKQVVEDFHGRGFTSWRDPKKSYQIKFDKKVSFIDGAADAKKWILLAQYKDPLRMNDKIVKDICSEVSDRFSPREIWVNFYYDGEYRGVYLLSEKIEVKSGRVDIIDMEEYYESIDETYGGSFDLRNENNDYDMPYQFNDGLSDPEKLGGYLIEMNKSSWDEYNGFSVLAGDTLYGINIKSPELSSRYSVKYISEYFQEFTDAVCKSNYSGMNPATGLYYYDYCDLDSLVDSYLIQCITSEFDSFSRSQFFYKDADEKMIAGPVWDMDLAFGTGWNKQEDPERDYLYDRAFCGDLIRIPGFRKKARERYMDVYSDILARLAGSYTTTGSFRNYYNKISDNLAMDTVIWPAKYKCGDGTKQWRRDDSLDDVLTFRVDWVASHGAFLDNYFSNMSTDESIIHVFNAEKVSRLINKIDMECLSETIVTEAREAYTLLSDEAKNLITPDEIDKLDAAEKRIQDIAEAEAKKEVGAETKVSAGTVTVTSKEKKTVAFTAADKSKKSIVVPATVKISGDTFKVTEIKAGAFNRSAATTVTISKNMKKIGKRAFAGSKVTKLVVKTKLLTKNSVKLSLKGSKVKTIKVRLATGKLSRKYVKNYKRIFKKENAGRKADVR